jgi:hypothetical protein
MDSRGLEGIHRELQRHEEILQSNGISLRTLSEILHNLEVQQQEQYNKIMSILEAHGEKISEIEMDCYKIKHYVQYTSEDYTSDTMTQQTSGQGRR